MILFAEKRWLYASFSFRDSFFYDEQKEWEEKWNEHTFFGFDDEQKAFTGTKSETESTWEKGKKFSVLE